MIDRDEIVRIYTDWLLSVPQVVPDGDPQLTYLERFLPCDKEQHILDAACGNGRYAFNLAGKGYRSITAVDLFPAIDTKGRFRYQSNSIDSIDLPDASVDFLYCLGAIFYLENPLDGLREFHRVMKPGAILILAAYTKYSPWVLDRTIRRSLGRYEFLNGVKFAYSVAEYSNMLVRAGFKVIDVDGFDLLYPSRLRPIWRSVLRKTVGRVRRDTSHHRKSDVLAKWLRSRFGYHLLITARRPGS